MRAIYRTKLSAHLCMLRIMMPQHRAHYLPCKLICSLHATMRHHLRAIYRATTVQLPCIYRANSTALCMLFCPIKRAIYRANSSAHLCMLLQYDTSCILSTVQTHLLLSTCYFATFYMLSTVQTHLLSACYYATTCLLSSVQTQ
jgi:hypothetical protein